MLDQKASHASLMFRSLRIIPAIDAIATLAGALTDTERPKGAPMTTPDTSEEVQTYPMTGYFILGISALVFVLMQLTCCAVSVWKAVR